MIQLSDEQLANIANDYYLNDLNLEEITHKYSLSRYLVSKALKDAKDRGVIQISIQTDGFRRNRELEYIFKKNFNLKEVFILRKTDTKMEDQENLVRFAAMQLQKHIKKSKNVGLTWGTTLLDVINNFQVNNYPDLKFIQLLGITVELGHRKDTLVKTAAKKFNAKYEQLPAPLYCLNSTIIQASKKEPIFSHIFKSYPNLDLIISAIGTIESIDENEFMAEYYKPTLFKDIPTDQIAGFIFGRPYTIDGKVFNAIDDHIWGISQKDILKTPDRFIIEKNRFKAEALLGALRTGFVTGLIINEGIAKRILQKMRTE
ncbi:sugar-binding transcriptional regulator [Lactobacillus corticis]|uniref:Citrate lyase regulator n=1 Tax=Lactobacillus corticis TaxID=2201249 RepID=A0A916QJG3_9LACO|nr:sugar-binding domain-containing protein [Lactobacillus corticis]GFZ26862.1 citrate lyase regulator [Lactobacillus corticis]